MADSNMWSIIVKEDFESGAKNWSNNSTSSTSFYGKYLGDFDSRHRNTQVSKSFAIGLNFETRIRFDFIRFDSWSWGEYIRFYLDDKILLEQGIDQTQNLIDTKTVSVDGVTLNFIPRSDYGQRGHST